MSNIVGENISGLQGFKIGYEIIPADAEAALIELIETFPLVVFNQDLANPRSSVSFGWKYNLKTDSFLPCPEIPTGLHDICEIAACFGGVSVADFAECLINRYEPGSSIPPHTDKQYWELIFGISLGAPATMFFNLPEQSQAQALRIELPPRSIYLMSGDARHVYYHSLPLIEATRWSITLRSFSPAGIRLRDSLLRNGPLRLGL